MEKTICLNNYTLISFISKGRFGHVYKVYNRNLQLYTALKIEKNNDNFLEESLQNDINNIIFLNNNHIHNIPVYYNSGFCLNNETYMELELLDGDLKTLIKTNNLTLNNLYHIIFELLYTLYEFRLIGFEHRDLKLTNIAYKINDIPRIYVINNHDFSVNCIIHPFIIDFNQSGLTINRNKTLFNITKINYVLDDLQKLVYVFQRLIKIIKDLNKDIFIFTSYLLSQDDGSSLFIYNSLNILINDYIK